MSVRTVSGTPETTVGEDGASRVLQRVVMPIGRDLDVLRLYVDDQVVDGRSAAGQAESDLDTDLTHEPGGARSAARSRKAGLVAAAGEIDATVAGAPGAVEPTSAHGSLPPPIVGVDLEGMGRRHVAVAGGHRLSFCTYFNAFPAGYWRCWSVLDEVVLRITASGEGSVIVYRSSAKGHVQRIASVQIDSPTPETHTFTLSLKPFIDGGWLWFDIIAGRPGARLHTAEWCARSPGSSPDSPDDSPDSPDDSGHGRTSIGITTFDRPGFCVDQLIALGDAEEVLDVVDEILVIDQGTRRVADHPDFDRAAKALDGRLRVITQANLGGSGGFARAMHETVRADRSDYVLLLDDDVITEPESILRAVAFADLARRPTIVGGHMFSLYDRSVLHAYGETLAEYRWFWGPAPNTRHGHDFSRRSLRGTAWLHRRIDVDYNGWWMCLIPTSVIREIGLPMPMFIKWDDAEYGIRARNAGVPTASLPGVAVWHVPWHDKDDTIDWQAYYHERNRLVSALLHSPYDRGGSLLKESLFISVKHSLAMQYSAAELILMAIEDVLRGPEHLHPGIRDKMAHIREFRQQFPDARNEDRLDRYPPVRRARPPRKGRGVSAPSGRIALLKSAVVGALKQFRPVGALARRHPQTIVPHLDLRWWRLAQFDSALVSSADGSGVSWYQRDPARFRALMRRTVILHCRLLLRWSKLSERYRAALPEITSPEPWQETFAAGSDHGDTP